jgi:purine-binding chemotaxis protein CheW
MSVELDSRPGQATFDWAAAYDRLDRLRRSVDPAERLGSEERGRILARRAEVLAQPLTAPAAAEALELICFRSGEQHYGLPLEQVEAVIQCSLLRIPGLGDLHLGVFNYHGTMVTAVDLALLLGGSHTEYPDRVSVVVIHAERRRLGLISEELIGIARLPAADIRPVQMSEEAHAHGAIVGVSAKSWLVLDGAYLVRDARLLVDEEVKFMGSNGEGSA